MCGIVAVLARKPSRQPPSPPEVDRALALAAGRLSLLSVDNSPGRQLELVFDTTSALRKLDASLRGVPGLVCLLGNPETVHHLEREVGAAEALVSRFEAELDAGGPRVAAALGALEVEGLNSGLVQLHDALWALGHDRLDAAKSVASLAASLGLAASDCLDGSDRSDRETGSPETGSPETGSPERAWRGAGALPSTSGALPPAGSLSVLWAVHVALRSLDRLEVRGRDSAGLHLMLTGHGLDLDAPEVVPLVAGRTDDPLFRSRSVRRAGPCLSFVYKAAAEIGELGDNVAALRSVLATDQLLARALASPGVEATILAHTRWASVGLVSEANAHPLDSGPLGPEAAHSARSYVVGALNGDIDNYAALVASEEIEVPAGVTTDAKVVPELVSRYLRKGSSPAEAFRRAVGRFEGSVGIAANAAAAPEDLFLALRGSGQSLNVGLAEDAFVVASEPYGLVEETDRYVRMDGEGAGQVVVLRRAGAGELAGFSRRSYEDRELAVSGAEVKTAEITTRDVDRRGFRHFFLKEISESPSSVRKTVRGKLVPGRNGGLVARLGADVLPRHLRDKLAAGLVHEVLVIGQGTAAVAGQAVAGAVARALRGVQVRAMPASELSGWGPAGVGLPDDMSDVLVVAVSQSGTTTDTNRTVDLVRARGAGVVSIVNRRNSDLVHKSDGVLYTSDGRDVEMSVASTKAFYSQVTAGHLLAAGLGQAASPEGTAHEEVLAQLRELPSLMEKVLVLQPEIARVAAALAPARRSWAVVGSGADRVAAAEVRIKLSELCYKAIALDTIEDKKHIDLSSEPLVLVCAASISGPNAADIAKEVAIFRAHKAAPVLFVPEGEEGLFGGGADVVALPRCHPELAFVLGAMAGHLFGYEAALAIDAEAAPLREARVLIQEALAESAPGAGEPALDAIAPALATVVGSALAGLRSGSYDGSLNASTAARLTFLLRYATGALPVEGYEAEMGRVGAPEAISEDLLGAVSAAIDELTRPVDAIKHQAKTVTVGISRSEEGLLRSRLVSEALSAGALVPSLGYRALRTLAALAPAVAEVLGYTRYRIEAPAGSLDGATITVADRGGIARTITSRTEVDHSLRGTKHRAAEKRDVTVFQGLQDGRTGIMVPEAKEGQVTGLTLLHARFVEYLAPGVAKAVLRAYQGRYQALVDAVTETRPGFDDAVLATVPVIELLTEPVALLARHWGS